MTFIDFEEIERLTPIVKTYAIVIFELYTHNKNNEYPITITNIRIDHHMDILITIKYINAFYRITVFKGMVFLCSYDGAQWKNQGFIMIEDISRRLKQIDNIERFHAH